jgi:hypothetical protein
MSRRKDRFTFEEHQRLALHSEKRGRLHSRFCFAPGVRCATVHNPNQGELYDRKKLPLCASLRLR